MLPNPVLPPQALTCPRCGAPATPAAGAQRCPRCGRSFALHAGALLDPAVRPPAPDPRAGRIKVRWAHDGHVKILDFGLAKAMPYANSGGVAEPTLPLGTAPGVVFGTAGSMAPEQVRGQAVDHRADIFAFGAIFYEMLGGRRAFDGESVIEKAHATLTVEPLALVAAGPLPPALEVIVWRCLEKVPRRALPVGARPRLQPRGAQGAVGAGRRGHGAAAPRPIGAEGLDFSGDPVSPDGQRLVLTRTAGRSVLVDVASGATTPVMGLEQREAPVSFSEDGRSLVIARLKSHEPLRFVRLDPATGRRSPLREIRSPPGGHVRTGMVTRDGRGYVVEYTLMFSDLYVAEGLR
jgi:hypothetical protein